LKAIDALGLSPYSPIESSGLTSDGALRFKEVVLSMFPKDFFAEKSSPGRSLTEYEKKCLTKYIPSEDLNNATFYPDSTPWFLMEGYGGITFGNTIYLNSTTYEYGTPAGIGSLGHELKHVGQYRKGATIFGFAWQGILNGHDGSPLEIPAIALEAKILRDFSNNKNCECKR
jgi:hypothetical protein